jgi:type I restriction enzyme M protein
LNWESLVDLSGTDLENHYNRILKELANEKGVLGQIFTKSQNKIQDPAKLYKLIQMINKENWVGMGVKDKGDIYEEILQNNAEDIKRGAEQYFTGRRKSKTIAFKQDGFAYNSSITNWNFLCTGSKSKRIIL